MSLTDDPDLRITIKLANFLFLTEPVDWTDPRKVGDQYNLNYKEKEVIVAGKTLTAFKDFMEEKKLPFEYDHAVGLFKYLFILYLG